MWLVIGLRVFGKTIPIVRSIQYSIVSAQTVRTVRIELEDGAMEITREIQAALLNNVINGAVD